MDKKKNLIIYGISILFSITLLLMIFNTLRRQAYYELFWYCYPALFLIIVGLFRKKSNLILSQLIIIAIPDLFYIFDVIYFAFTGNLLLGIAKNFVYVGFFEKITSSQHFYILPLSLLALSLIKIKKNYKILLISLTEIILIFLVTLLIVPSLSMVNCVHSRCVIPLLGFLPYYFEWFILIFGFALISYLLINLLIKNSYKS